ncbi:MAG: ABC transporter permease [Clostridium sp.]
MKKIYRKTMLLISNIVVALLFISLSISLIYTDNKEIQEFSKLTSENSIKFKTSKNSKEILDYLLEEETSLMVENSKVKVGMMGYGVMVNKTAIDIPISDGRNFQKEDFLQNKNVAVIGKEAKSLTKYRDGKEYIEVYKEEFEVVGISNNTFFKNSIILPINKIPEKYMENGVFTLYGDDVNSTIVKAKEIFEDSIIMFDDEYKVNNTFTIKDVLSKNEFILKNYVAIFTISLISVVICTAYFVEKINRELFIRQLCGANYVKFIKLILSKGMFISVITTTISLGIHWCINEFNIMPMGEYDLSIYNLYAALIINLLVIVIMLLISIKKIKYKRLSNQLKGD